MTRENSPETRLTRGKRAVGARGGTCRVTFDEFVRKLGAAGIGYDIFRFGDTVYVEVRDRDFLFGFGFDLRGEPNGGWIHPSPSDHKAEWQRWVEYLQGQDAGRSLAMGRYAKGDHVKIEAVDDRSGESEWLWLLVESSDDESEIILGMLDSQPVVMTDMRLGQELAVGYEKVRDHRRFG